VYRGVGHVRIMLALAFPFLRIAPVQDHLAGFVRNPASYVCPGGPRE
jgi:hypothetical protein